jgi:hypothetical protein
VDAKQWWLVGSRGGLDSINGALTGVLYGIELAWYGDDPEKLLRPLPEGGLHLATDEGIRSAAGSWHDLFFGNP